MRRAIIVDAPDLPPEECEFYITSAGIADTDKVEIPSSQEPELEFEIECCLACRGFNDPHIDNTLLKRIEKVATQLYKIRILNYN